MVIEGMLWLKIKYTEVAASTVYYCHEDSWVKVAGK